jgi:hypothetical protein
MLRRRLVRIPCVGQLGALAESGKTLEVRSFYSGDPNKIMSCLTCSTQLGTTLADSLARHHGRQYFGIPKCRTNSVLEGAL